MTNSFQLTWLFQTVCQALSLNIGRTGKFWWLFLMNIVGKDETTKVYIPVPPGFVFFESQEDENRHFQDCHSPRYLHISYQNSTVQHGKFFQAISFQQKVIAFLRTQLSTQSQ